MTNISTKIYKFVNQIQSLVNDMLTTCTLVIFIVISVQVNQIPFQN